MAIIPTSGEFVKVPGGGGGGGIIPTSGEFVKVPGGGGGGITWQNYFDGLAPLANERIILHGDITRANQFQLSETFPHQYSILFDATSCTVSGCRHTAGCNKMVFPNLATTGQSGYCFSECGDLTIIDFGTDFSGFNQYDLFNNRALTAIVLRSSSVVSLANTNGVANGTPFKNGGTGGTIYIPKSLYDHLGDGTLLDYKAATNWSTVDGYGTITWAQIEGSVYEKQYADGTPIS